MEEQFKDLFKIRYNNDQVAVGKILIAEPFLRGGYFDRSVVYIIEHGEKGSVGFILNKVLNYSISELVKELKGIEFPVYLGGPVEQNQLFYFHRIPELTGSISLPGGVYWGGDFKLLCTMLQTGRIGEEDIRFFTGYSGWDANQLQGELEESSWMVGDIEIEDLFSFPKGDYWGEAMRKLGGKHKIWANFPQDPILN